MVQIRVGDVYLDLYEFDPPKLNFAIEDITDTSTRSEFSQTFRIPATSNNSSFFETAFDINGYDFDITQKINAELMIDGVLFRQGELRLNNIYITRENERIDYEVIFFSTTRSLATSIGEDALCDLNLSELDHELNYTAITKSWEAYPSGTTTDGLFDGNVLYPLVDFGNTYDDNGDPIETRMAVGGGIHFTTNSNPLLIDRFKPMIRTKYLWDKIFEAAGFTYTSTFLNSNLFKKLYTSAWGNEASVTTQSAISNLFSARRSALDDGYSEQDVQGVNTQIEYTGEYFDYNNNFDLPTDYYIVPETGTYQFGYSQSVYLNGTLTSIRNISFRLTKLSGGVSTIIGSDTNALFPGDYDGNYFYSADFSPVSLTAGDKIYMVTNPITGMDDYNLKGGTFYALDAPGEMNVSFYLDCEKKQIDFIKDIITKFRLVLSPDKNNSSNFIIEPWSEYIASGDEFDWTDKLDVSKDFKISPIFYTQKSKIIFTDKEDGDFLNETYYEQFNEVFGTLNTFSNNELLKDERKIETDLSPTPVTQIEGANQTTGGANNHGMDNFIIPQIHTHSSEDTGLQHLPIRANTRYLFYNGTKDTGITPQTTNTWKLKDELSVLHTFDYYPMISEYSDFPIQNNTLFFNWQKEDGYIKYNLLDIIPGQSVYDEYWSDYINSLYDRWSRRVTAYFVLNAQDLLDFSYDDVIFVKDTYYYVEKIYDVPLGEKASVKVDLIKLLNR